MVYNPNKFSKPFNPQFTSQQAIEKTNLNMGALHYTHSNSLLMGMSQSRLDDNPAEFARFLKSLFAITKIKIKDLVDVPRVTWRLNNLQKKLVRFAYLKHCVFSQGGCPQAEQELQQVSFHVWRVCESCFDQVYSAMNEKGMILPDKANDSMGKYLNEFGVNFEGNQQ